MQENNNNSLSLDIQKSIDSKISESDNSKIKELSDSINLEDSISIMSYGSAAQNKMVQFSENTLSTVMNKDLGDIGPSQYWSTIGLLGVFSLTGWSRLILTGFLVSRHTQDTAIA